MSRDDKQAYRRKRNGIGWLIALGWVIFWWVQPSDGSWSGSAGHAFMVFVAFVTAPFGFVIAHYIARGTVEAGARQRDAEQQAAAAQERQRAEAERIERQRQLDDQTQQTRLHIDRGEMIRKLGSVSDYLKLLPSATEPDRAALIQQSIDKELRDLIAKHDPRALAALIGDDQPVRLHVVAILQALEKRGPLSPDAQTLKTALGLPGSASAGSIGASDSEAWLANPFDRATPRPDLA